MRLLLLLLPLLLLGCISEAQQEEVANTTENETVENVTQNETVCACQDDYVPVCGTDGKTYQNECEAKCKGASVDYQGICNVEGADIQQDKCSDTDGGKDKYTQGNVTAFGSFFQDSCDGELVKEYYCEGNEAKSTKLDCPEDFKCKDGECIRGKKKCTDSDGGYNIYEEGTVVIDSLIDAIYIDKCTSDYRLREYSCEDDELKVYDLECPGQCVKAHCLK